MRALLRLLSLVALFAGVCAAPARAQDKEAYCDDAQSLFSPISLAALDPLTYVRFALTPALSMPGPRVMPPLPDTPAYVFQPVWIQAAPAIGQKDADDGLPVRVTISSISHKEMDNAPSAFVSAPPTLGALYVVTVAKKGEDKPALVATGRKGDGLAGSGSVIVKNVVTVDATADLNNGKAESVTSANIEVARVVFSGGASLIGLTHTGFAFKGAPMMGSSASLESGGGLAIELPGDPKGEQKFRVIVIAGPSLNFSAAGSSFGPTVKTAFEVTAF